MIGSEFENILLELGTALKTKLKPDKNGACLLKFKNGINVQIEPEKENIYIVSEIAPLSQGRFRENIFREALKANGLPLPRNGIFSYSKKTEALVLFENVPMKDLSGEKLAELLRVFVKKAHHWKESITRGEIPSFLGTEETFGLSGKAPQSGVFGLIK